MKKLASTFPNMLLSLVLICSVMAAILAVMKQVTLEPIKQAATAGKIEAIKEVVPAFDNNPYDEKMEVAWGEPEEKYTVYPAKMGGQIVGYAIEMYSKNGFSGRIDIMVGFDMAHHLHSYKVLDHKETAGLGSKMQEWFQTPMAEGSALIRDVRHLDMQTESPLKVSKDNGKVDAITAATISSRAFLEVIENAYQLYLSLLDPNVSKTDAQTSATAQAHETDSQVQS